MESKKHPSIRCDPSVVFLEGDPVILMHNAHNFLDIFEDCARGGLQVMCRPSDSTNTSLSTLPDSLLHCYRSIIKSQMHVVTKTHVLMLTSHKRNCSPLMHVHIISYHRGSLYLVSIWQAPYREGQIQIQIYLELLLFSN